MNCLICYFKDSAGQELGSGLTGWCWVSVSLAVAVEMLVRVQSPKGLIVAGRSSSEMSCIAVDRRPWFLICESLHRAA